DVMDADDGFLDKTLEGFAFFALNQGEVCTAPSRALIQESMADDFYDLAIERVKKIKQGNPLDTDTMMGAQASNDQFEKIMSYMDIGKQGGAEVLIAVIRLIWAVNCPVATTSSPPCYAVPTICACSRKRSSVPWSPPQHSRTTTTRCPSPMTRCLVS